MTKIQSVKGTQDFLPDKYAVFMHVVSAARKVAKNFSYSEIALPIMEHTEVFKRSLGDASDIVHKEMYSFEDKKGRSLTLRPEFTASVVRSIISNGTQKNLPLKLFSVGPLFRYERPQKGRYRQFHQVNFEYIGSGSPAADAEVISAASDFLKDLGLKRLVLEINSLGDSATRKLYVSKLVAYFSKYKDELSEDSKVRLENNPLRILDSKDCGDRKLIEDAPKISEYLNKESKEFFNKLLSYLDALGVGYKINDSLVRGLDYYTHTVFEFTTDELGAQNAVLAGGRYDKLIKQMGGDDIPAIGFASGIERLMELFNGKIAKSRPVSIFVLSDAYMLNALKLAQTIRGLDRAAEIFSVKNMNKSMKKALDLDSKFIIFVGKEEVEKGIYTLKNLDSREERKVKPAELLKEISTHEF